MTVFELKKAKLPSKVIRKVFFGVPRRSPERLESAVLLEPVLSRLVQWSVNLVRKHGLHLGGLHLLERLHLLSKVHLVFVVLKQVDNKS